jgi:hypothetical protein
VIVRDSDGNEFEFRDWLTGHDRGSEKLRNCVLAVSTKEAYEAAEISAYLFPGHDVRVKIGVEKKHGWPDRAVIEDYAAAVPSAGVVHLRQTG